MAFGGVDGVDVILRLANLQSFVAGTSEAAASVRGIGTAAKDANAETALQSKKMAGAVGLIRKASLGTAVAIIGAAAEGFKMSVNFNSQMEKIHTQAGATQAEVVDMTKAMLAFSGSGQTGQGPQALAAGLYHLVSVGLNAKQALLGIRDAANLADVGGSNLEDTATALGSAFVSGIKGAGDLTHVVALMNATVGQGNMHMEDLVQSLGTGILPAAKVAGIGIKDVFGALAVLTDTGMQGSSAMAQLATALHFITNPSAKATDELSKLGLGSAQLLTVMQTKGLPAALGLLKDRLSALGPAARATALGDILPGGRGRVLSILMDQLDRYNLKEGNISKNTNTFTGAIAAAHQTMAFKLAAAWAQIQSKLITLGDVLTPVFSMLGLGVAKIVIALLSVPHAIAWMEHLPIIGPFIKELLVFAIALAAIGGLAWVGSLIAGAIYIIGSALATTLGLISPWMIAVAGIAALAFYVIHNWTQVKTAFVRLWNDIVSVFKSVTSTLMSFVRDHWKIIGMVMFTLLTGPLGGIVFFVITHFNQVMNFLSGIGRWISRVSTGMWGGIKDAFKAVLNWIIGAWDKLHFHIPGFKVFGVGFGGFDLGMPHIPMLAAGGTFTSAGSAIVGERGPELITLPRGATVSPMSTSGSVGVGIAPMQMPDHVTILQIDRREIARAAGKYTSDRTARA